MFPDYNRIIFFAVVAAITGLLLSIKPGFAQGGSITVVATDNDGWARSEFHNLVAHPHQDYQAVNAALELP